MNEVKLLVAVSRAACCAICLYCATVEVNIRVVHTDPVMVKRGLTFG